MHKAAEHWREGVGSGMHKAAKHCREGASCVLEKALNTQMGRVWKIGRQNVLKTKALMLCPPTQLPP